ncbi:MAG: hypothetical protein V1894_00810 [Chloroflexota bacterium]
MSEALGKIEKPEAQDFKQGKKLFLVPLVFMPVEMDAGLMKLIQRYWEEAEAHLKMLEEKLSQAKKLYHELITGAEEKGLKDIEKLSGDSFELIKRRIESGARLEKTEDEALLGEFLDWGRCLALGLQSEAAFSLIYDAYVKVQKKRNEFIVGKINETLGQGEAGILFIREGHGLQFPVDIQVFYVAPPALDEIKRYLREPKTKDETKT